MREAEIKQALSCHLTQSKAGIAHVFLEELELAGGEVRADFVHVPVMHCYEIKSEGDNLRRLISQGSRYGRVFDRITLVTAERHLKNALAIIPPWWGVIIITSQNKSRFRVIRAAKRNRTHEPRLLVTVLKRDECLEILTSKGEVRGWKSKSLYRLQDRLAELLSLDELRNCVREQLMVRAA